jgi:hypothetical protein
VPIVLLAAWAERAWLGPTVPPPPPPIDTILDRGPVTRTIDDGITIEAPPVIEAPIGGAAVEEPSAGVAAAPETLADPADLVLVRDDTVFRSADQRAWFAIWGKLQAEAAAGSKPRGRKVTFAQLFSQPRSFRGRRVRIAGTIRRLQEVTAPTNALGIGTYCYNMFSTTRHAAQRATRGGSRRASARSRARVPRCARPVSAAGKA